MVQSISSRVEGRVKGVGKVSLKIQSSELYWEDCLTWSGVESSTHKGVVTHGWGRCPGGLYWEDRLNRSGAESSMCKGVVTHGDPGGSGEAGKSDARKAATRTGV